MASKTKPPLKVLIAASEAAPLAKEGGLGDVVGSLAPALAELGCQAAVALPAYREITDNAPVRRVAADLPVRLGDAQLPVNVLEAELASGVPAYLVQYDPFFGRFGKYGDRFGAYGDNDERYILFSKAVFPLIHATGFAPDVILANDWQTGLIAPLLHNGALPGCACVFVIHNLGYLGLVPGHHVHMLGLPDRYYTFEGLEFWGSMSLLKAGIAYADALVTVSPTYAREIQTPEMGAGLDGLLRHRSDRLHGILNGIDPSQWNPETDPHLAANYSIKDRSGKKDCKRDLLARAGLSETLMGRPVMGMVTRLVSQKGIDIFLVAAQEMLNMGMGLVVLGSGDPNYEQALTDLALANPGIVSAIIAFDPAMSRKVFAGSDLLCVPSLYEPCGLTQMYAMAYGTLPVVRATGGLADTVADPKDGNFPGTGFSFGPYWAGDLAWAASRARDAYYTPAVWEAMTTEAMKTARNFSRDHSARQYLDLLERVAAEKKGPSAA
ncbi:MAG: glycogen synthase [Deltaproteobacteria bacterium]|nr:glycogen synthase [Deltaproteobacteria bacterium]